MSQSSLSKRKYNRYTRKTALAIAISGLFVGSGQSAFAFQFDMGESEAKVTWDNTFKYNTAWRLKNPDTDLTTPSTNNFTNARNYNDGDLNFKKGQITSRFSLLSEMDASYRNFGARVSAAGAYDSLYMDDTDNPGGSMNSANGINAHSFNAGTRNIHGRKGEILDAFLFGKFDAAGSPLSVRVGKYGLIWGETAFFGANGIAGTMAPTDIGKLQSVPGTTFKEAVIPVKQISGQIQINQNVSIGAFYQFEWTENRLAGSGSYFSASDATGPGAERLLASAPIPGVAPNGLGWYHGSDATPKNSGQGGLQIKFRLPDGETDYGLYAVRYHDKGFAGLYTRAAPTATYANSYGVVYGQNINSFGASFSKTIDAVNVSGEASIRRNVPLVSYNLTAGPTAAIGNTPSDAIYAVGNSAHINVNALWTVPSTPLFQEASMIGEIGWNRRTSVVRNADFLDPSATRDAWGLRFVFTPTYRQVLPGVDISVPIGVGYNPKGRSSVVSVFNNNGIDKGGDISIGIDGSYLDDWRFSLSYTHWYGSEGPFQVGLNGTTTQVKSFKNYFADRDLIAFSIRRTF